MWSIITWREALSVSSLTPVTVTVCLVFQFCGVKVSGPDTVAALGSKLSGSIIGVTVTSAVGWVSSTSVYSAVLSSPASFTSGLTS